ncbi:hypothetical protein BJA01nite_07380 [Bradyrhizobium japonicum]|nr:hypothetical protein BJ6T_41440 [Bradyrhizobium japonicum USDA 6]GEC43096.1 hypothetical protein BJA01nite_07380 [Bradyrhizobium japonicum]
MHLSPAAELVGPGGPRGIGSVYHARLSLGLESRPEKPTFRGKLCAKGRAVARGRRASDIDHSGCMAELALNPE